MLILCWCSTDLSFQRMRKWCQQPRFNSVESLCRWRLAADSTNQKSEKMCLWAGRHRWKQQDRVCSVSEDKDRGTEGARYSLWGHVLSITGHIYSRGLWASAKRSGLRHSIGHWMFCREKVEIGFVANFQILKVNMELKVTLSNVLNTCNLSDCARLSSAHHSFSFSNDTTNLSYIFNKE